MRMFCAGLQAHQIDDIDHSDPDVRQVLAQDRHGGEHLQRRRIAAASHDDVGFALDGLMMATRCGSLDPAVVLYLAREGRSLDEIEHLLYRQSGLLGVSGITGDMRALIASDDPRAREALDLFSYRAAIEIAGLAGALGGLDRLVFTAGIGERAPTIRAEICTRLAWLGLRLDARANAQNATRIGAPDSLVDVRVIATDERQMIARHTSSLIEGD